MTNLDETELARLEALVGQATPVPWAEMNRGAFPMVYGPNGERVCRAVDKAEDSVYIAAACNDVPALIAEIRRLREALSKEHRAWQCAEGRGDGLEMENAVLREKVEEWEWFEECFEVMQWLVPMGPNRADGCTEAVMSTLHAQKGAVHADRE